jgi:hypothetical protein
LADRSIRVLEILVDDRTLLRRQGDAVREKLSELRLEIHPDKYRLMPTHTGVDFAGFVVRADGRVRRLAINSSIAALLASRRLARILPERNSRCSLTISSLGGDRRLSVVFKSASAPPIAPAEGSRASRPGIDV